MKRTIKRGLVALVALCMLLCCLGGCTSSGKTMMELKGDGASVKMSVNVFQLYLSRMKGMIAASVGEDALTDSYWDVKVDQNLTTRNEQYTNQILEEAKTYLAALYLFELKELELSDELREQQELRELRA